MNEINVRLVGFSRIDFKRAPIRKALRLEANLVRDEARALVGSKGVSAPGAFPGMTTGTLRRAIRSKVARSGLAAFVRPEKTARMGKYYYPAFLVHGVKQRRGKALNPGLKPRADYMVEGLARRSAGATEALRSALENSLVPRQ